MTLDINVKAVKLSDVLNKHVGEEGSIDRTEFELSVNKKIMSDLLKKTRKQQKLTQAELGERIGVQKAQISKLENNVKDARLSTLLKAFKALNAKVSISVTLENGEPVTLSLD